jgi:hypothetical protein
VTKIYYDADGYYAGKRRSFIATLLCGRPPKSRHAKDRRPKAQALHRLPGEDDHQLATRAGQAYMTRLAAGKDDELAPDGR